MFDYICVLDFEATCDKVKYFMNEIIEFPSVLMKYNGTNYVPVDEFQLFCKPLKNIDLSEFCKELTGIRQEQVNSGLNFTDALVNHKKWLYSHIGEGSCIILTCGYWDLRTMMPEECKRWGITKPPTIYTKFINIKLEYQRVFNFFGGMAEMLDHAKLTLDGKHHSGIDDCRNIGKILQRVVEKGGVDSFQVIVVDKEKYKIAYPNRKKAIYWKNLRDNR